jgi:hypothetical protein
MPDPRSRSLKDEDIVTTWQRGAALSTSNDPDTVDGDDGDDTDGDSDGTDA